MATVLQYRWVGLSGDTKPTTAPDGSAIAAGAAFSEADTGAVYYWSGTAWLPQAAGDPLTAQLVALQAAANEVLQEIWRESVATRLAVQEAFNEGRDPAGQTDFREAALAFLDRPDTEDQ